MLTEKRREEIIELLKKETKPITGTELSKRFGVSRQVIVQDIAVIRAQGNDIMATSSGYMIPYHNGANKIIKTLVCKHENYMQMEEELQIMVDAGAKIIDVIVEHPVYGEIRSSLMLQSRMDVEDFMSKVKKQKAEPLAKLTQGEHIHTLEVPNEKAYDKIVDLLSQKGYIISRE